MWLCRRRLYLSSDLPVVFKTSLRMTDKEISFEPLSLKHGEEVMDIYNYYIEHSLTAYPGKTLPYEFFNKLLDMTKDYPAYTIKVADHIAGFCFLHAYNPLSSFKECAEITCFLDNDWTGKGIGRVALDRLEADARQMGIRTLLANIAATNTRSLAFHLKHGFKQCGRFEKILKKKGKRTDIIWMQKHLTR
jgi:phosphinothricin acetyltransferase